MVSCLPKKQSSSVSSQSSYSESQEESSLTYEPSFSCFCKDILGDYPVFASTNEQKSKCKKTFICRENAVYDCLTGRSRVWDKCY